MNNSLIFYVAEVAASARFYERLLEVPPVENSPGFAMFILPSGFGLGLWQRAGVEPPPAAPGGGCELGFRVATPAEVDRLHAEWHAKGACMLMPPRDLDFGRSFVAVDPDGHRLRVYAMAAA
ncbi:drug:proton antiporter [Rhodovarius crocodyli]|uniref:Drug:proton antiporter n=1 Tax=Rhodovarius crocodyli TaxID=1979269 RepID=A0A437MG69_9PROT|nr:VOC family protein [Rhodovarius crocodyli]RVT96656.1 drug:proton antiporter [Rhodovarius crocodyli]